MSREVVVLPDAPAVAVEAARRLAEIAAASVAERGRCVVALSGGSTPALFHRTLAALPWRERISWARLHVCWSDERCVPPDNPESNYGAAKRDLLAHVPLPAENIHRMAGEEEPAEAAREYEAELRRLFGGEARFDLVVLGLGLDGHVASLFPGALALEETERLVVATVSPAGQARLTLTLAAINAARNVLVLVTGAGKAGIVRAVLREDAGRALPAQRVKPADGTLTWMMDREAADL
jgi:6-phosphogluconolactonase